MNKINDTDMETKVNNSQDFCEKSPLGDIMAKTLPSASLPMLTVVVAVDIIFRGICNSVLKIKFSTLTHQTTMMNMVNITKLCM